VRARAAREKESKCRAPQLQHSYYTLSLYACNFASARALQAAMEQRRARQRVGMAFIGLLFDRGQKFLT